MVINMGLKEYYNEEYNKLIDIDESGGSGWYKEYIAQAKDRTILDVGCGAGSRTEFLVNENKVIGLELNEKNIEKAKKRGLEVMPFDVEKNFSFKNESFDIVICSQVLEHLLQPQKTLYEMHRVLKNGGYLFLDVPNHYGIISRVAMLFGDDIDDIYHDHKYYFKEEKFDQWDYPHIRFFTYSGFRKVIEESGFIIVNDQSYKTDFLKLIRILNIFTHDYPIQSAKSKSILKLIEIIRKIFKVCGVSSTFNKLYKPSLFSECFFFICKREDTKVKK